MSLLLQVIDKIFLIYMLMIFARIFGSWFPEFQQHPIMKFIAQYTDPYLEFFKRIIPPLGMFDLSPIVAIFSLRILETLLQLVIINIFR